MFFFHRQYESSNLSFHPCHSAQSVVFQILAKRWRTIATEFAACTLLITVLSPVAAQSVRIATFNVSFYGNSAGEVAQRLAQPGDSQASAVAEIIQRVRPDILLLNEVDYDSTGEGVTGKDATGKLVELFQQNYLGIGQNASQSAEGPAQPIEYPHVYSAPSNTGVHSGLDLDRNGRIDATPGSNDYGGDCWGFGRYPGQYAMVLLSRFPIDRDEVRTFRAFLWKHMPDAQLPEDDATEVPGDWYSVEALAKFPLSSKSHWDVPIDVAGQTIHLLASHPTPPTYDGPEDRNGRRNHDEIRFWVDYIGPAEQSSYIYDDHGRRGGLSAEAAFVILGDLNGDPHDGDGPEGISMLLASPKVSNSPAPESDGGEEQAKLQGGVNASHVGNPRFDTLDASDDPGPGNLRLDYVIPARCLKSIASGVFWPKNEEQSFRLVGDYPFVSSDHRLVWVDVDLQPAEEP